jgi:hypothetical protein
MALDPAFPDGDWFDTITATRNELQRVVICQLGYKGRDNAFGTGAGKTAAEVTTRRPDSPRSR